MKSSGLFRQMLNQLTSSMAPQADKPEETPESTLTTLWLFAQGRPCSVRNADAAQLAPLDPSGQSKLQELVKRRLAGEPLAHLVGRQHFMGLEMLAGTGALVPRIETELLGRAALEIARRLAAETQEIIIVDVCTGSGNVALALAAGVERANVYGADLSVDAVSLAQENAAHLELGDRVKFKSGDMLEPFSNEKWAGSVDLLTCNPPYISSAKVPSMAAEIAGYEPALAFDGGPFGVSILLRLLQDAPRILRPGGWLVFEIGLGQGPAMEKRLKSSGNFDMVQSHQDAGGHIRALSARRV
jgi:release factor glutamine methyltransferase